MTFVGFTIHPTPLASLATLPLQGRVVEHVASPVADCGRSHYVGVVGKGIDTMDEKTRTELEAAVYRRLVEHLRGRTDVQNIDR